MIPPIARRFVAGDTSASALSHARGVNDEGISVILNRLGEHHTTPEDVESDAAAYRSLADAIDRRGLDACLSIKPTQVGLDLSADRYVETLRSVVEYASDRDVFVWCDMEGSATTDDTLDAFREIAAEYPWSVGQCLQSNLKRTRADLEALLAVPGRIRIVKGAYDEPSSIAYVDRERVDEAYRRDVEFLLSNRDRGVAVGTHDPAMIGLARRLADEHGTDYQIQMLMGVREDAQRDLAEQGVDVAQYAPYGTRWADYFWRRVRERRANATFAIRAILGR
ncbi:proline dehydrogenase family protein [Halopenitus salinus]|uniref:proline dehydrogenase n=1 Tax=Halopenitus salinus TaxID=1198295 RepID=A0ABD5UX72_9EURY